MERTPGASDDKRVPNLAVHWLRSTFVWIPACAAAWVAIFVILTIVSRTSGIHSLRNDLIATTEIFLVLLMLAWLGMTRLSFQKLVLIGMSLAAGLILAMLVITVKDKSVHPDEFSHLAAYQYYANHLLPPAVNSPATIPSTSIWGYSYLFQWDVVYDIAARVTGQLRKWTGDDLLASRLFQFGMWLTLCGLVMRRRRWAVVLSVVLLSPQVWYVFSYFNADAFPLFLSLLLVGFVADEEGGLHRFLAIGDVRSFQLWGAVICVGLLFVSKLDYLPVIPICLLWLATKRLDLKLGAAVSSITGLLLIGVSVFSNRIPIMSGWHVPLEVSGAILIVGGCFPFVLRCWKDTQARHIFMRLASFVLLAILVAAPRVAWDMHVNGWPVQKAALVHSVVEARAGHAFKPSVIAQGKGYPTIGLAKRGVSLGNVFFAPYHWASVTFASAFGVYGYMNVYGPWWLYWLMYAIAVAVTVVAMYSVMRRRPGSWPVLMAIVIGGAALVLASSLLLSWASAFQPQGRYLFAILPMIALLISDGMRTGLSQRTLELLMGAAFVVSACSFAFVALPAFV